MPSEAKRWFCSCVLVLAAAGPGIAHAHGTATTVLDVLAADAQGISALRLSTGLVQRRVGRFVFVCPALWGDELSGPTRALPDGSLLIAARDGLYILDVDGRLAPHVDPNASGLFAELVSGPGDVFGLRIRDGMSELLRIDAQSARVIWREPGSWYSLAGDAQQLVLQRLVQGQLEQRVLAPDGSERSRAAAQLALAPDYVFARSDRGQAYALLLRQGVPELGFIGDSGWQTVAMAQSTIVGPSSLADLQLLALDGKLQRLGDVEPGPLSGTSDVTCLTQQAERLYVCTRHQVREESGTGAGAGLFSLAQLTAPALRGDEPQVVRERCDYQWQDLRIDLHAVGVSIDEQAPDGGAPVPADSGALEAGAADAGQAAGAKSGGGCSTGTLRGYGWVPALLLSLALLRRRPRRA